MSGRPKAVASGFMESTETEQLFEDLASTLAKVVTGSDDPPGQTELLKTKLRETAREFLSSQTRRRPMIIPVVLEV